MTDITPARGAKALGLTARPTRETATRTPITVRVAMPAMTNVRFASGLIFHPHLHCLALRLLFTFIVDSKNVLIWPEGVHSQIERDHVL